MQKIKNIQFLVGIFFSLLTLSSCRLFEQEKGLGGSSNVSFVIVNVLDKEYYDDCHIKGSINVPFEQLEKYALAHWNKDTTEIVVHCTNYKCTASSAAWQQLNNLGFKKVFAYEGGTAEAKQMGIPVEGPCKEIYLKDFEKPATQANHESAISLISAEDLKKKMQEFALNS